MIAIIGCGNANRSDDAAGLEVVRALKSRANLRSRDDIRILDAGTDGMAVMFAARGCSALVVVDACKTGGAPGALFEVPGHELERTPSSSLNLHDFRWDNALFAGRKMYGDDFPGDVMVYLIEAKSLDLGLGLSAEVGATVATVVKTIEQRLLTSAALVLHEQAL